MMCNLCPDGLRVWLQQIKSSAIEKFQSRISPKNNFCVDYSPQRDCNDRILNNESKDSFIPAYETVKTVGRNWGIVSKEGKGTSIYMPMLLQLQGHTIRQIQPHHQLYIVFKPENVSNSVSKLLNIAGKSIELNGDYVEK